MVLTWIKIMSNEMSYCEREAVRGDKSTMHSEKNYNNLYCLSCVV
jgi:hypothetical protein